MLLAPLTVALLSAPQPALVPSLSWLYATFSNISYMHCVFPGGSNFRSCRDVKQLVKTVCTITITHHSSWVQQLHMRSSKSKQKPVRFFAVTKCYFTIWLKYVSPWNSFLLGSDYFLNCSSNPPHSVSENQRFIALLRTQPASLWSSVSHSVTHSFSTLRSCKPHPLSVATQSLCQQLLSVSATHSQQSTRHADLRSTSGHSYKISLKKLCNSVIR
jgi:hypothetical protein